MKMFAAVSLQNKTLIITLYTLGQKLCSGEKAPNKDRLRWQTTCYCNILWWQKCPISPTNEKIQPQIVMG